MTILVERCAGYRLITSYPINDAETQALTAFFRENPQVVCTEGTVADVTAHFGVATLEDAYLRVVGRDELSRASLAGESALTEEAAKA